MEQKIKEILVFLYGRDRGGNTYDRLGAIIEGFGSRIAEPAFGAGRDFAEHWDPAAGRNAGGLLPVDQRDALLITYGDQFLLADEPPLKTLNSFLTRHLKGVTSGVHLLPFSPYSSDDGFSVIDYRKVNPDWGDWPHIRSMGGQFRLMFDLVLNHISAQSHWFQEFLRQEAPYRDYFITVPQGTDLSLVFRPRALPLLHPFRTSRGELQVWTTFSADQIDLNYQNPDLLLEMIRILLFYVEQGAQFIRLDAIAYLWKQIGTPCIHLEQTHKVVQLFRAILDVLAPWVMIITETNVPHRENISYFGDGYNEAQMVYQFSLPPLVLDAFLRGDATHLSHWASTLEAMEGNITFFNFLASHDGIGVLPAHGLISDDELKGLAELAQSRGGFVSYKSTPQGEIPYELNISYFDAITDPADSREQKVKKFLASQAIMLALAGVPGIYIHSLLGTPNYLEGVRKSGIKRTINRQKLSLQGIEQELEEGDSLRGAVFRGFAELLRMRSSQPAFHPLGPQRVLSSPGPVLALLRQAAEQRLLCLFNTGSRQAEFSAPLADLGIRPGSTLKDILGRRVLTHEARFRDKRVSISLAGYQFLWLELS